MESPYEQEKPPPESGYVRPPGLEMVNGFAIFLLVLLVFWLAQSICLVQQVIATTPELKERGFSPRLLNDSLFQERATEMLANGDVVSYVSFWSGLIGFTLLVLLTSWWKRGRIVQFLGLRPPALKPLLAWIGLFALAITAMEAIAYFLPRFDNSFMENVLGSARNIPMLYLGSALMPALFEEFFLRGLLFGSLRHLLDKHVAVAITAGIFTFLHLQYPWYLLLFVVLPLGVILGYARANTGSIWTSVLLHLLNNLLSLALPQLP